MFFRPICSNDTLRFIDKLNNSWSCGYDEFSNNILKYVKYELEAPLTFLTNLMFETGTYPYQLKLAMVQPLYKKGDPSAFENYRPISLLSSFAKFFELSIYEQFADFLLKHGIVSERQHGFVRGKGIETALFEYVKETVNAIDNKIFALGLFVDYSGAFDSVNHDLLLYKLERHGVRGRALDLFKSYITARRQIVKLPTGVKGNLSNVDLGVPQGSILGPVLYITFTSDLFTFLNSCNFNDVLTLCYADDTNFLIKGEDINQVVSTTKKVYEKISLWSEKNCLRLNASKTVSVLFTSPNCRTDLALHIGDIMNHTSTKLLGIKFDSHLNWNLHIDDLVKTLRISCFGLRSLKNTCDKDILLSLYYGSFHSRMRFGIALWGSAVSVQRVFIVQKYAVRLIAGLRRSETCRHAFREYGIMTVYDTYIYELCCFVHKNYNYFFGNEISHKYNTRNKNYLLPDKHSTTFYQRQIFFNGCKFYNALPVAMKSANMSTFKRNLKTILLNKTCYSVADFFM